MIMTQISSDIWNFYNSLNYIIFKIAKSCFKFDLDLNFAQINHHYKKRILNFIFSKFLKWNIFKILSNVYRKISFFIRESYVKFTLGEVDLVVFFFN